jgi:dihydrofolate reductase
VITSIIVAMSENNVIAKDGEMPWRLPDEFRHFKETTMGHHIIMGRKTYDSLGKALKGRKSIVISRNRSLDSPRVKEGSAVVPLVPEVIVVHSIQQALEHAESHGEEEAFIIGGGEIYRQSLVLADRLYLTVVHHRFDGDVFFPEIDYNQWVITRQVEHPVDERHKYAYTIYVMERKHLA